MALTGLGDHPHFREFPYHCIPQKDEARRGQRQDDTRQPLRTRRQGYDAGERYPGRAVRLNITIWDFPYMQHRY